MNSGSKWFISIISSKCLTLRVLSADLGENHSFCSACCCLVGSKLCSTNRGNLIQLPLKLNSYIRLSTLKLQEDISQWALIIHILYLLPPFSLLISLQVIKSQVVLCVMEYQANFLIFCRYQSWSHPYEEMEIAAAMRSGLAQREIAKGEITHMGGFGAAVHISTSLTALCSIWESFCKGRMSFHPNVGLKSPKSHRLNQINPSRAGQDTCTSHLQLFSLNSPKKYLKYSNFMSHVKIGLNDLWGLLQP